VSLLKPYNDKSMIACRDMHVCSCRRGGHMYETVCDRVKTYYQYHPECRLDQLQT